MNDIQIDEGVEMAKVTLTLEDYVQNGKPMLSIRLDSDPPFSDDNATAAQGLGVKALRLVADSANDAAPEPPKKRARKK